MSIYKIAPEIEDYFIEQYEKCEIKVVGGHWPEMKTKEDVDKWIKNLESSKVMFEALFDAEFKI